MSDEEGKKQERAEAARIRTKIEQLFGQLAAYKNDPDEAAVRVLYTQASQQWKLLEELIGEEKAIDFVARTYNRLLSGK